MKPNPTEIADDIVQHPKLLGESLRRLRLVSEMSVQQTADALGVSKSFISMVESGQRGIKFEDLLALMRLYKYPLGWFLTKTRDSFLQSTLDKPLEQTANNIVQPRSNALLMTGDRLTTTRPRLLLLRPLRSRSDSEWLELMLPAQSQLTERPLTLEGEVRGVVQRGTLLFTLNNDEYRAKEGEEFCFDGRMPHIFRNYLTEPLVVTLVITPAGL
jgi:transcriptional regulator with XRE-family HTH domain